MGYLYTGKISLNAPEGLKTKDIVKELENVLRANVAWGTENGRDLIEWTDWNMGPTFLMEVIMPVMEKYNASGNLLYTTEAIDGCSFFIFGEENEDAAYQMDISNIIAALKRIEEHPERAYPQDIDLLVKILNRIGTKLERT